WLGDTAHSIIAKPGSDLIFHTSTNNNFVFNNGNVGIGSENPDAKLQVNGDIFIDDQFSGLILKSPDGQCWKGTVDDNGSFAFESIDCNMITGENKTPVVQPQTARIFPNPAGNKLSIELPIEIVQAFVALYNEQGILLRRKKLHGGNNSISLKRLPYGVLVVKVFNISGELLSSEKVIHQ
ncbi:MAG: T9SS type A sorting domain-containing protein, partial [Bacteroidales bacterium]|nr:T9SS type A sorting domain-containing protein [Bacteroidales bacterium]